MSNITITNKCPFCGATHEVEVDYRSYINWQCGELIQNAMPQLTATEREQLISGLCPKCQKEVFAFPPQPEEEPIPFEDCDGCCTECPHYADCYADDEPDDLEMGFDPYCGCYTDDC